MKRSLRSLASRSTQKKKKLFELLEDNTHYDKEELAGMYKNFLVSSGGAESIPKETFTKSLLNMGVEDKVLQSLLFSVFDPEKKGEIQFQEYVTALSAMTRGTPNEKLEFLFTCYDIDNLGYLAKDSMGNIMEAFCTLVGPLVTFSGKTFESHQQLLDEFFEEMDSTKDGTITMEEYIEEAMSNPDIIRGLKLG